MRKSKKGNPIFSKGDVVYAPSFRKDKPLIIQDSTYNGLVWMYSFQNDVACMGELYVTRQLPESSLRELIIQSISNIKAGDQFSPKIMRWQNKMFQDKHVSEVDYENLNDRDLLSFYEGIIIQAYKPF